MTFDFTSAFTLLEQDQPQAAVQLCKTAIQNGLDSAQIRTVLGRALAACGQIEQARQQFSFASSQDPTFAVTWFELALLERAQNKLDAAEHALLQALQLAPNEASIYEELGHIYIATQRFVEAIEVLKNALGIAPQSAHLWNLVGRCELATNDFVAAEHAYSRALTLDSNNTDAMRGLAIAAQNLGRIDGAIWACQRLIMAQPNSAQVRVQLAELLRDQNHWKEAREQLEHAKKIEPLNLYISWLLMQTLPVVVESIQQAEQAKQLWLSELAVFESQDLENLPHREMAIALLDSATNFYLHYLGEPLLDAQRRYGQVLQRLAQCAWPNLQLASPRIDPTKIRVGFVSAHFHQHTVWRLFKHWLLDLDRGQFEVFAFHVDTTEDHCTAELKQFADHFQGALPSIDNWVTHITSSQCDVLIYLDIAMHPHTQTLSSLRLAPTQCVTWGHPITSGSPQIDFFLSSDVMEPSDGEAHYSEKLVRLPGLSICYEAPRKPTSANPIGLDREKVHLLCPQNAYKLHPAHDELFVKIAQAQADVVIHLLPNFHTHVRESFTHRLGKAFKAAGLDFDRHIKIHGWLSHDQFLSLACDCDLLIDSMDWSGGNTTLEAIAMGLPTVTLAGSTMRSRHTAGILTLLDLEELITYDTDSYLSKILQLVESPAVRNSIRDQVRANCANVFENSQAVHHLAEWIKLTHIKQTK